MKTYIHFGTNHFDKSFFKPITQRLPTKPDGGFWGSPIDGKYTWEKWNIDNDYNDVSENSPKIYFTLISSARVLTINNEESFQQFDKKYKLPKTEFDLFDRYNWKQIANDYDAMEISISDYPALYMKLYTWDCDSICVFNPNVIIQVDK